MAAGFYYLCPHMSQHTILGAGGVIGRELAQVLPAYADTVRLVSRHPQKVNAGDELVPADLTDKASVSKAVAGSSVVYLTAGLPYRINIWREQWPVIMDNVISACLEHDSALIFFDNIYAYGKVDGPITETCPLKPSSEKGKVRVRLAETLEAAWEKKGLKGAIVRAADFYGKGADHSMFDVLVLQKFKQGKKAQWICNDNVRYSMTYTLDAALGTAMIGHTPESWQQVWHLPSSTEALTAGDLISLSAKLATVSAGRTLLKKPMLKIAGIFDKTVRELVEMTYQYQYDYIFDSSKFEAYFNIHATAYQDGLQQTLGASGAPEA